MLQIDNILSQALRDFENILKPQGANTMAVSLLSSLIISDWNIPLSQTISEPQRPVT